MAWEIEITDQFETWWDTLSIEQQVAVTARVDLLADKGPDLKRPTVGEIKTSDFAPRMKELIIEEAGALRVLFVFDPRRTAILLLGGNKAGNWNRWYRTAIPAADHLYREHLIEIQDEI